MIAIIILSSISISIILIIIVQVGTEGTPKSPGDESKTAILAHPFQVMMVIWKRMMMTIRRIGMQMFLSITI